ncbi:MAG TPA: YetF domain-containing protein [Nocardioidaceae bacterium]|jgi:uncharacterized membrane protein YcaP (DUF421 family)|nr:YetF domain-containing protein [Nocardioidaceae bacterium]
MWNDLINLGVSAPEKILRTIVVYVALAVLLRLAGKRDLAQLNSFDLVVMLLLSNVVQNAVIGPDDSLAGGLLGAAVLVGFNALMVRLSVRSDRTFRVMEGTPTVLARDGSWDTQTLRRLGLRQADVEAALRRQNANDVSEAERVTIEPGGAVVATVAPEYQTPTKADVDRLAARLRLVEGETVARLEAKLDELLARTALP